MNIPPEAHFLDRLAAALSSMPGADRIRIRRHADNLLALDVSLHGDRVALDLFVQPAEVRLLLFGRTYTARTYVRSLLRNMAWSPERDGDRHLLETWRGHASAEQIAQETHNIIASLIRGAAWRRIDARTPKLKRDEIPAFWWNGRVNFGDLIGPWLVSSLTGKRPVNVRGTLAHPGAIMSVGSVINMLERPGYNIWGSGLLAPLHSGTVRRLRARKPKRVAAVRGRLTRQELVRGMGWDVPEVYGDPALLLPRIFQPQASAQRAEPVFIPHYKHKALLPPGLDRDITVIDVERDAQSVVSEIAMASHVVATSLHGLIVAQAYGVPWTWLQIEGQELAGDYFKFEDFFSTLDTDSVSRFSLAPEMLSGAALAAAVQRATVPALNVDLDQLWDAYPHEALYGGPLRRQQQRRRLINGARRLGGRLAPAGR